MEFDVEPEIEMWLGDKKEFFIRNETITVKGTVPAVLEDISVHIQVFDPENKLRHDDQIILDDQRGKFDFQFRLDSDNLIDGQYQIKVAYAGLDSTNTIPFYGSINKDGLIEIPSWVKYTAGLWADNKMSDADFTGGIGYLIKHDIITIPLSSARQTNDD